MSELKQFLSGIPLKIRTENGIIEHTVRCALLCIACDLPAGRKVCGFLSHSATKGCSKCLKEFSGRVGSMCYSGFDRSLWPPRTNEIHRYNVNEVLKCQTKTTRAKKESELGCRYSVLLDLPYFDPPTMLAVDPMHNLFLGTGKHMINIIWLQKGLLNCSQFSEIQKFVDSMSAPCSVGRIPRKIETGFAGFKADQFKNWITLYSIPALFSILPTADLECWRHFVLACRLICKQSLSFTDIGLIDALLMKFCLRVEQLYGKDVISPNMHMHGHLRDVIKDFGPIQEFWLYSFERFNGILGNQPSNNKNIEPQLMQRFLNDNMAQSFHYVTPEEFNDQFQPLLDSVSTSKVTGSLLDRLESSNSMQLPTKYVRGVLSCNEQDYLKQLYSKVVNTQSPVYVNSIYQKYQSITLNGREYRSSGNQASKPVVVQATWNEGLYGNPPTTLPSNTLVPSSHRPVNIHYFMQTFYTINNSTVSVVYAYVSWFFPHPDRFVVGKPAELWCRSHYEVFGLHSFLPINHLVSRCAYGIKELNNEQLLVTVPLVE